MSSTKITKQVVTVGPDHVLALEILTDGVRYALLVSTIIPKMMGDLWEFEANVLGISRGFKMSEWTAPFDPNWKAVPRE